MRTMTAVFVLLLFVVGRVLASSRDHYENGSRNQSLGHPIGINIDRDITPQC